MISLSIWFSITGTQKPNLTLLYTIFPTFCCYCYLMMNFETSCSNFRLTVVIPDLEFGELVWHRAVCLVPHVAMSSTAGPEDALRTIHT